MAGKMPDKIVYTSGDPTSALSLAGTGVAVAVKIGGEDGATPEQIQKLKDAGIPIVIWQSLADQQGVDAVKQYGAVGYIAQGESLDQMNAAAAVGNQVDVPKTIVTNGNYLPTWPPGWGVSIEFYQNVTDQSQQNLAEFIKTATAEGATSVNVVIGSWSANIPMDQYINEIKSLQSQGIDINGVSAYIWTQMTAEQQQDFLNWMKQFDPSATSPQPSPPPVAGGGGTGGDGSGGKTGEPRKKSPPEKPADGTTQPWRSDNTPSGGSSVKPPPPREGASYYKTTKDGRATLSYMPSGAILEKSGDGNWYRVGTWDPNGPPPDGAKAAPGASSGGEPPPPTNPDLASAVDKAKADNGGKDPAWRTNPNWGAADGTMVAAANANGANIDPSQVLEQRPTADGQGVIWRMADGTYIKYENGLTSPAGSWDNSGLSSSGADSGTQQQPPPSQDSAQKAKEPAAPTNPDLANAVDKAEAASGGQAPAWRTNPGWTSTDTSALPEGLSADHVLEQRPGANGAILYRMDDGTYLKYDPSTGQLTGAGTWDSSGLSGGSTGSSDPNNPPPPPAAAPPPTTSNYDGSPAFTTGGDFLGPGQSNTQPAPSIPPGPANTTGGDFLGPATPTDPSDSGSSQNFTPDAPVSNTPSGGGCFPAGTLVLTPNGSQMIEKLKVGDLVQTWSMALKKAVPAKVTEMFKHNDRPTIELKTTGGSIVTTTVHRFWTGDGWLPAGKLVPGKSVIQDKHGKLHKVLSITDSQTEDVYNFHVDHPDHNYFAGQFLVHNMKLGD